MRLSSLLLGWLLAAFPAAQGLPTTLAPSNPAPIVYVPPERLAQGPAAAQHVVNVFLPLGPVPAGGWPVVVATGYGGGASVPPAPSLSSTGASAPLWNLVAAGIAVVHFGTPGIGNNRGLWYPPGHPSARWESFRPAHDNPEKSAIWALQWTKVQTLYPFDLTRVAMRGLSGGAVLALRTTMAREWARPSGSAQVRASTRVAAVLAIQPPTSAWALEQGPELTIPFPKHLEQAAQPGIAAATLSQVDPELQKDYSLMRECFASAEARAWNAAQPVCLVYGDPVLNGTPPSFALDAEGFPLLHDRIKQPLQHDSWFGYVFWKRLLGLSSASAAFHAANSVFAMRDVYALPAPDDVHTSVYSGTVKGAQANRIGHDWLVRKLLGTQALVGRCAAPSWTAWTNVPLRVSGSGGAGRPSVAWARGASGAGWELDLEVPLGASAWLLVGQPAGEGRATPAGSLHLEPSSARSLAGTRTAPDRVRFGWSDAVGSERVLQVLVLDRGAHGARLALSDAWLWRPAR